MLPSRLFKSGRSFTVLPLGEIGDKINIMAFRLAITTVPNNLNSMIKITDKLTFTDKIINGTGLQIVRFCADWSGPCQMMGPIYREMFSMYSNAASFYRVDIDEAPLLKNQYGVVELPTILFYKNGEQVDFAIGLISKDALISKIEKLIK